MIRQRLIKVFKRPLSDKLATVTLWYWRAKTSLFYRWLFGSMGRKCVIIHPMLILNGDCIAIGDRVLIRDGARLEALRDPYGRKPRLTVGSDTNIEQGVHIVCHCRVNIGSKVSITGRCAIVDVTHPYAGIEDSKIGAAILDEDSYVEIGDGAFLGYGSVILPNVKIGRGAVVGANSVVTRDVPDYAVVAGSPAKVIRVYRREA